MGSNSLTRDRTGALALEAQGISHCTAKEVPRYVFVELPQYEQDSGRCRREVGDGTVLAAPRLERFGPRSGILPRYRWDGRGRAIPAVGLITKSFPVLLSEK